MHSELPDPARSGQIHADDEELILLRVIGNAPVPQENDLEFLRATAGMELVVEAGRPDPRPRDIMIDPLTEERMQTSGLRCAILGTFYDEDAPGGPQLAFGSDIDNVYAASRLWVYKPYGGSLETIVSYMAEQKAGEVRRPFEVGTVRYASTRRREHLAEAAGKPTGVPVHFDIADIVSHKTAVLGMTRKGKSNTNKVVATATHQYAVEQAIKIGQLIFDPAGEYGSVNTQDGTALAQIGPEHVVRYMLGAKDEELAADGGLRALALNFFDDGSISDCLGARRRPIAEDQQRAVRPGVLRRRRRRARATRRPTRTSGSLSHARRARALVYACFIQGGPRRAGKLEQCTCPLKRAVREALIAGGRPSRRGPLLARGDAAQPPRRQRPADRTAARGSIAEALASPRPSRTRGTPRSPTG